MPILSICATSTLENVSNPPLSSAVRTVLVEAQDGDEGVQALNTPTRICGNSTCQKACQAVAPQARAASVCCTR